MGKEVVVRAVLDPNTEVVKVHGDGYSKLVFTLDATQLAQVLMAFAEFSGKELMLRISTAHYQNGQKKRQKHTIERGC